MTCKHTIQAVSKKDGVMTQTCVGCGEIRARWAYKSGAVLYDSEKEVGTPENRDFDR